MAISSRRVRAMANHHMSIFSNTRREGFWNETDGLAYRVINQSSRCTGPPLVVFKEDAPVRDDWAEMPPGWLRDDGTLWLRVAYSTLVPLLSGRIRRDGGAWTSSLMGSLVPGCATSEQGAEEDHPKSTQENPSNGGIPGDEQNHALLFALEAGTLGGTMGTAGGSFFPNSDSQKSLLCSSAQTGVSSHGSIQSHSSSHASLHTCKAGSNAGSHSQASSSEEGSRMDLPQPPLLHPVMASTESGDAAMDDIEAHDLCAANDAMDVDTLGIDFEDMEVIALTTGRLDRPCLSKLLPSQSI